MRVEIVTTASSSALSSPLVLPWRRRTFLFRRRRGPEGGTSRRSPSTCTDIIHKKKTSTARKFRGLGGRSALKIRNADIPSPVRKFPITHGTKRKQSSLFLEDDEDEPCLIGDKETSNKNHGAALESIGENADRYHQKRRIQRMRAIQIKKHNQVAANNKNECCSCAEPKKLLPFPPTSPCARTPSKKKVLQLTGLSSISPISRPPVKKQRFF